MALLVAGFGMTTREIQAMTNATEQRSDVRVAVARPDAKNPTPALIEAAYVAQDDLSKPPEQWAIEAAAEVITAYIDAQDHTEVHVLGHPRERR